MPADSDPTATAAAAVEGVRQVWHHPLCACTDCCIRGRERDRRAMRLFEQQGPQEVPDGE